MLLFIDHKYRYVLEGELPGVNLRTGSSRFRFYEVSMPLLLRKWFRAQRVRERNTYLQYLNVCLSGSVTESSIQKSISTLAAPCFLIINVLVRARHNAAAKGSL